MKSKYFIFALSFFLFVACGESEPDCSDQMINDLIIGAWNLENDTVEFAADGTLIDVNDQLIGPTIQGKNQTKSYTSNNEEIVASITNSIGFVLSKTYDVISFDCDSVQLKWVSGTTNLNLTR